MLALNHGVAGVALRVAGVAGVALGVALIVACWV